MKLEILDDIVTMVGRVHKLAARVARHDRDMAAQMKRSSTSVGLNAAEGVQCRGGTRTTRLDTAMGSGRETIFALRIAAECGYLAGDEIAREVDEIDRIVATLYKLARR